MLRIPQASFFVRLASKGGYRPLIWKTSRKLTLISLSMLKVLSLSLPNLHL